MDLNPSKPYFEQNVAVKKVNAVESSDDEEQVASAQTLKDATLPDGFFDEKQQL
jgi:hypothetical protein